MRRGGVLAVVAAAGCLPAPPSSSDLVECEVTADCNQGAGEVCEAGVCWGDPPVGVYSAIMVPPTALQADLVMSAIPTLILERDGWLHADGGGALTFDRGATLTGRVSIPCPAALPACTGRLPLAGQLRWSRPAGFPGGPRLTGTAEVGGDGEFQLVVPRPRADAPVTLSLSFAPAPAPIGGGAVSPAMLMAPYAETITLAATDLDGDTNKIVRDLDLDPATLRTVTGRIVRPFSAPLAGWQIRAEVVLGDGARQRVSTLAEADPVTGVFSLRVDPSYELVDVVTAPPPSIEPIGESRPSVRAHDLVIANLTEPLPDITVPQLGVPTPVGFVITGTDGSGGAIAVDGATVVVRLDHALSSGLDLELETSASTIDGRATVPLFPILDGADLQYTVDVLPGPASELASRFGESLTISATPTAIALPRRRSLVGRVLGADGDKVAGATVAATLSTATLCALLSNSSRLARSLASTQIATNANGEFTLFVDDDLLGVPLAYDVVVRPATGDGRPQWTFVELAPQSDNARVDLVLPDAANVRGVVLSNDHGPTDGATLSIYEQVDGAPACAATLSAGTAVLRGLATTDASGTAAIVLPRPAVR